MVDARGLSCPLPVVMVQKEVASKHPDRLQVLVDAMVCVENISRFAANAGYKVAVEDSGGEYTLTLSK